MLKLLKKIMLVLIERCLSTQCITVFAYGVADPQAHQGAHADACPAPTYIVVGERGVRGRRER